MLWAIFLHLLSSNLHHRRHLPFTFAVAKSSTTMPDVNDFIRSLASGFTSPTTSLTPIVMVHTESSTNLLLGFKLNGSNYAIWASMIELYATSQGKLGYLTGLLCCPGFQIYTIWKVANC